MAYRVDKDTLERYAFTHARAVLIEPNVVLCLVLGEHSLYVDPRDGFVGACLMLKGYWEAHITVALMRLAAPGMHVANVGANVGYYTIVLGRLVGKEGHVYAYEPQAYLADLVRRSAYVNGFAATTSVYACAVGDQIDQVTLRAAERNNGVAHVVTEQSGRHEFVEGETDREVPRVTLDNTIVDRRLDLLMMDVEGSEEAVWDGMPEILTKNPDLKVVMEFTPRWLPNPARFVEKMQSHGYRLNQIADDGEVYPIRPDTLLATEQTQLVLLK